MMLDFFVENFGPFKDCAILSMFSTYPEDHPENVVENAMGKDGLLTSAVVFGPNASGKSVFFDGMKALIDMTSCDRADGIEFGCYNPFMLSADSEEAPVTLGVRFVEDGILYEYYVRFLRDRIIGEALYHNPNGRRRRVFERESPENPDSETAKEVFRGANAAVAGMTGPCTTYLYMASKSKDEVCRKVWQMIQRVCVIGQDGMPDIDEIKERAVRQIRKNPKLKEILLKALYSVDLGISDIIIEGDDRDGDCRLLLKHNHPKADGRSLYFTLGKESTGIRQMLHFSLCLAEALENGSVIMIDEFGSFIHPEISRWIIKQFVTHKNPNHAQIIVNGHALGIMDTEDLLGRDQIYFTNKNRETGSSELYALARFKGVRKDLNVLNAYIVGRFHGIPQVYNGSMIE
ncbi:MAG: ATP-binding protein [Thermoplasmata archaeon]|nr:ATP-binding protein [Thermoplasmata archaeon]